MTILPGQPIAPPDAPSPDPAPPRRSREPRTSSNRSTRTLAAAVAGVLAVGGGGAWFVLHSSGGSAPAAAITHKAPPATSKKLPAPHTRPAAMNVATRVFAVLPAQLPGWKVDGKPTFNTGSDKNDPVDRSIQRCFGAATGRGIGVKSPDVFQRTATPSYLGVDATLGFMRTPAKAAADLAVLGRASTQQCLARSVVGRTVPISAGTTMRFTSMKRLRVPGRAVGMQFDGQISSNVVGDQSVRVVMLATVDRATEILLTSTGLGAALPLSTDVRVMNAIVAQTHRLIA